MTLADVVRLNAYTTDVEALFGCWPRLQGRFAGAGGTFVTSALLVDLWLEAGSGLPPHLHPRQEERWSVVEGRAKVRLGKETRTITPADGEIGVLPDTVHGFESDSDADAHLGCEVIPARRREEDRLVRCRRC